MIFTTTDKPNEPQPPEKTIDVATEQPVTTFFPLRSEREHLLAVGLLVLFVLGMGYFLLQSDQPTQSATPTLTPTPTAISSATPITITTSPTPSPSTSPQPTTQPVATKKPAPPKPTPTPTTITGVEVRFADVHFYGQPEPNKAFTPFRVANGGSITVANEKNDSEFDLFAIFANYGTDESKDIWVHYYVDGVEVDKGIAYLPGNMVRDELVTRDSAQPVSIPASGSHVVKIVIDPDNKSNDVNHANNTYTFTYTVK